MHTLRALGLVIVVAVIGLLSGGAAGTAVSAAMGAGVVPATAVAAAAAPTAASAPTTPAPAAPAPAAPAPAIVSAPATAPIAARAAAPLAPAAPRLAAGTPCAATARACIELSSNRAWLIRGGAVEYGPVSVTHGRKGFRTPPGTFRVTFKDRGHVSSIYHLPMPYSVFFNGGIAFHQGSLRVTSHGCVHLSRTAAITFFNSLSPGNVVQVVS